VGSQKAPNARCALTQRLEFGQDGVFQLLQGGEDFVADGVLDQITELFDGIKFGAVRWQRKQPDVDRHLDFPIARMEPGLIPHHQMQGGGIAWGNLLQKDVADILAHAWSKEEFHPVVPVHFQGFVEVASRVLGAIRGVDPRAFERPTAPDDRQESIPVLIRHSESHWTGTVGDEGGQPLGGFPTSSRLIPRSRPSWHGFRAEVPIPTQ